MVKKWLQNANLKKNRVRNYMKRMYGDKAFYIKNGKEVIKTEYLNKVLQMAKESHNTSLERAIMLAKRLKKMANKK